MLGCALLALAFLAWNLDDAIRDARAVLSPVVRWIMAACIAPRSDTVV